MILNYGFAASVVAATSTALTRNYYPQAVNFLAGAALLEGIPIIGLQLFIPANSVAALVGSTAVGSYLFSNYKEQLKQNVTDYTNDESLTKFTILNSIIKTINLVS